MEENNINNASNETGMQPQRPPQRPTHRRRPEDDKFFKIRNVLNIIFIIGAIAGMAIFYFHDRTMGTIVILTAMAFKIAECCFRFIRQ